MSKNIFQIWKELGEKVPFGVRRDNWSNEYYTIVERVEIYHYPYGKAYGYPTIKGEYSNHYDYNTEWVNNKVIPCGGCYQWTFVPDAKLPQIENHSTKPSKQRVKKFNLFYRTSILDFGKYKGKTLESVFVENPNYIFWCIKNIPSFFIYPQKIIELAKENNIEISKHIIESLEGKKGFFKE